MKKVKKSKKFVNKIALYMLLTAVLICGGLFFKTLFTKDVLVLKSGEIIAAEKIWTLGDTIHYRTNKTIAFVKKAQVQLFFSRGFQGSGSLVKRMAYYLKATQKDLVAIIPLESVGIFLSKYWGGVDTSNVWTGVLILLGSVMCCVIVFVFKHYFKFNKKLRGYGKDSADTSVHLQPVLTSIQEVVEFFLNLFRCQLGAKEEALTEAVPLSGQQSGPNRIYELQVKHQGKWKSRRITVGPLGEGTGSKSQCFYVVYDTHLVVKIPPIPIKDFKDYIRRIKEEEAIVEKLAPLECIIPNFTMILEKINIVPGAKGLTSKTLEDKYIYWLEANPKLQNHLKIRDTFVFIMDLSKYHFLGHVMDRLRFIEEDIYNQVIGDAEIIWDYNEFEDKYGNNSDTVCFDLQKVYAQFHKELKNQLALSGEVDPMSEKEKMKWLLLHLAGKDFAGRSRDLPDPLVTQIKRLLDKISAKHPDITKDYRELVTENVRKRSFYRKKSQNEGIIANLISLLDWMGKRKVAMRDIKPDNLLVAGDFEGDPLLLASAENYTIGLIDVETAVDFETAGIRKPGQPQLGGTPLYATPSHFFNNELLNDVYGDLPQIFHLQDWYAVIGIIYELVTGEHLFIKTANKVHEIIQTLRVSHEKKRWLTEVYRDINRIFWQTAVEEFDTKIHKTKTQLRALRTVIPENTKQWFKPYLIRKKEEICNREKACIDSQTIFKNEKECRRLLRYSYKDVIRLKAKYEKLNQSNKRPSVDTFKVNQLLDDLILLKKESFRLSARLASLENVSPSLSADIVLETMFGMVVHNMYKKQWEMISTDQIETEPIEKQDLLVVSDQDPSVLGYTFTV